MQLLSVYKYVRTSINDTSILYSIISNKNQNASSVNLKNHKVLYDPLVAYFVCLGLKLSRTQFKHDPNHFLDFCT